MSEPQHTLFVGIGSPHGDDRIGWLVADLLLAHRDLPQGVIVRKAAVPLDLLDWLEGCEGLHVCDASQRTSVCGEVRRWQWDAATAESSGRWTDEEGGSQKAEAGRQRDGDRRTESRGQRSVVGDPAPGFWPPTSVSRISGTLLTAHCPLPTALRSNGSHDFELPAVLELAGRLNRLPRRVIVWGVSGKCFEAGQPISEELNGALPVVAASILNELKHARNVSGAVAAEAG